MKLFARAMVAASAASMLAITTAKADQPDIGTAGSANVLTALSTGTMTITFLFARAEFTNYLMIFAQSPPNSGLVGDGIDPLYPVQPLITVVGQAPVAGAGVPGQVVINVTAGQVLLFGICTTGTVNPPGGDPNSGCPTGSVAFYTGPAGNNLDGNLHAQVITAAEWNTAAILSGCTVENPNPCSLAAAGTTVVGFEDIAGQGLGDADFNDLVFSFTNVSTVPEPGTMGLLALGLVGLSGAGLVRRRSAKRNQ